MNYQPLISSGIFDGVKNDVAAAGSAWLLILAGVAAVALITKLLLK